MPRELVVVNNQHTEPRPLLRFLASRAVAFRMLRPAQLVDLAEDDCSAAILSGTGDSPAERPATYDPEFDFLRRTTRPVFGICGGFQILCRAWGGALGTLAAPRYGRAAVRRERPDPLLAGVPDPFLAFVKHRFEVTALPPGWTRLASAAEGGLIYGGRHPERPQAGFQFHPERHHDGERVLENFLAAVAP